MAEEEGDDEDDQEDLGDQEEGDADPEPEADFLFQVHGDGKYRKGPSSAPVRSAGGQRWVEPVLRRFS